MCLPNFTDGQHENSIPQPPQTELAGVGGGITTEAAISSCGMNRKQAPYLDFNVFTAIIKSVQWLTRHNCFNCNTNCSTKYWQTQKLQTKPSLFKILPNPEAVT